jgi:hypothetical protein
MAGLAGANDEPPALCRFQFGEAEVVRLSVSGEIVMDMGEHTSRMVVVVIGR